MTARIRLIEKPVIVVTRTTASRSSGWSLANAESARRRNADPQPISWRFQKALFLLAKKGVGRNGKTAMVFPLSRFGSAGAVCFAPARRARYTFCPRRLSHGHHHHPRGGGRGTRAFHRDDRRDRKSVV